MKRFALYRTGRSHFDGGFTLIELVVVIVILTVVALLVYPKLPSSGEGDLRSSARSLAATIRYLEDLAVTGKSPYRMRFNLGDSTVEVRKIGSDGTEETAGDVFLRRELLAGETRIADVVTSRLGKTSVGELSLDFGPDGLQEFVSVHLQSPKGLYYTVQAYPRSGRVKVFENYSGATL